MELPDLKYIQEFLENALQDAWPSHSRRVGISYPDSPNPVCFFELDGNCFAQGNFWANNEYRIEAMNNVDGTEIMNESGTLTTVSEAKAVIQRFCQLAASIPEA